jgi:hypothetical protein
VQNIDDDEVASHLYLGGEQVKADVLRGYDDESQHCIVRGFGRGPDGLINSTVI